VFRSPLAAGKPTARRLQSSPLRRMPFEAFPSPTAGDVSPHSVPSHRWFHSPRCIVLFYFRSPILPRKGGSKTRGAPRKEHRRSFSRTLQHHDGSSISRLFSVGEAVANAPPLPVECCPLLPWASRSGVCPARPAARGATGIRPSTRLGQGLSPSPEGQAPWANSHRRRWC